MTWRDKEESGQEYDQSGRACEQSGNPRDSLETKRRSRVYPGYGLIESQEQGS